MSNSKEQPRMRATSFADPNALAKASSSIGGVRTFRKFVRFYTRYIYIGRKF